MSRHRGQSDPGRVYCRSRGGSSFGGQLVCVSTEFQAVIFLSDIKCGQEEADFNILKVILLFQNGPPVTCTQIIRSLIML